MAKETRHNFISKLHLGCSDDLLFEKQNLIHFKNGKAYCTNGHIAIIQDLSLHELNDEDIQNLEGKYIHQATFKDLIKYDRVYFRSENIAAMTDSGTEAIFNYYDFKDQWYDVEGLIDGFSSKEIDEVAINPDSLKRVNECLVKAKTVSLHFKFNDKDKGMVVTSLDENHHKQMAYVMPVMIRNEE